jgi:hypothetical protein
VISSFLPGKKINTSCPFILEANAIQMSNPEFKNELIQWLRFSEKEAMQKAMGSILPVVECHQWGVYWEVLC